MSAAEREKLIGLLRERERPDPLTPAAMRARMEELGEKFPAPDDALVEPVEAGERPAEWVAAPGSNPDRQILYLHGGGYVQGSLDTHRLLTYHLSHFADARVLALDYRLAPEHVCPAAIDDAVAAYKWMLAQGGQSSKITVAGDSAGGGLAISTLVAIQEEGLPMPAAGLCISPWIDMAGTGASMETRRDADPMLDAKILDWFAALYLGGADAEDPKASPLHADLSGLPPLLVQVGDDEILLDDATRLAARAQAAGVSVDLRVWEGMMHVWHLFSPLLSEGLDGLAEAGDFIRARSS
jgi:epsilon-lactone hydrolase